MNLFLVWLFNNSLWHMTLNLFQCYIFLFSGAETPQSSWANSRVAVASNSDTSRDGILSYSEVVVTWFPSLRSENPPAVPAFTCLSTLHLVSPLTFDLTRFFLLSPNILVMRKTKAGGGGRACDCLQFYFPLLSAKGNSLLLSKPSRGRFLASGRKARWQRWLEVRRNKLVGTG